MNDCPIRLGSNRNFCIKQPACGNESLCRKRKVAGNSLSYWREYTSRAEL